MNTMRSLFQHKLILVIVAAVIAVIIWYGLSQSSAPAASSSLVTTQPIAGSTDAGTADLVSTLLALRSVTLSVTIFSDSSFQSLKDFTTAIVPEPVGRSDPFAPLPPESAPSATSLQSAQIFTPHK